MWLKINVAKKKSGESGYIAENSENRTVIIMKNIHIYKYKG
jgi:hypothetical protein